MEKIQQPAMRQLIRIFNTDVSGNVTVGYGLTKIKGIGINFAKAFCVRNNIKADQVVGTMTDVEVKELESKLKELKNMDYWYKNRQKDYESGDDFHMLTSDLKFNTEFDIKRMQKVRTYKGIRHAAGLPVRGQRTKAHFRHGKAVGVSKKKANPGAAAKSVAKPGKK